MELLNLPVALELSKAIAKTGGYDERTKLYLYITDGFQFEYEPSKLNGTSITVTNAENGDPFICDWVNADGVSKPCRLHLQRYDFPRLVIEIAIKRGIIKV